MEIGEFGERIQDLYDRAGQLHQRDRDPMRHSHDLLADSLEELRVSMEELQVAHEELYQQNDEMLTAKVAIEIERQRYIDLFEFAPDGYIVTDANGTIQEANRMAATLLTVPQRFLIGKPILVFVPDSERREFRRQLAQLKVGTIDRLQEWEVSLYPRANQPIVVAMTIAAVRSPQNETLTLRWLLRDITQRKQTEAQLQQAHFQNLRLQEAVRLKSQFLNIMSHEFRTPLNAIIGFSQLLLRRQLEAATQTTMVERIYHNGTQLLTLLSDILDLAQMDSGYLRLNLEAVNLAEIAQTTLADLRQLAAQKDLSLELQMRLEDPIASNDGSRFRQILVNLVTNAIKFTDTGGITVQLHEPQGTADQIELAVQDTGIGIEPQHLDRIFTAFQQVDQTLNRRQLGTGLGLAMTRAIVHLMQGSIRVDSQLGQGSSFRVLLPRCVTSVAEHSELFGSSIIR